MSLLLGMIPFVEFVALFVAFLSLFIVWGQYIERLKREYEETVQYQHRLLRILNGLVENCLLYVAVKHKKEEWVRDIECLCKMDSQTEYDVERLRRHLEGIYENFQLDISVLQSNHYIQPDIRDFVSDFRNIIRPLFTLDSEYSLPEMSEHVGRLLLLEWWLKEDSIKAQYDALSKLNTMLDKMTKEL